VAGAEDDAVVFAGGHCREFLRGGFSRIQTKTAAIHKIVAAGKERAGS
jgi:hypothetical protein